jgi:anaerobic selenocysteine-containing dehydrogenase
VPTGGGRLLRASDLTPDGDPAAYVGWDESAGLAVTLAPSAAGAERPAAGLALSGEFEVPTLRGPLACRPVLQAVADSCAPFAPALAAEITGVPADEVERAAHTLWSARPLAYYAWSGVEQHADSTQVSRAIGQLYALTGCLDAPGGNVLLPSVAANAVDGAGSSPRSSALRRWGSNAGRWVPRGGSS